MARLKGFQKLTPVNQALEMFMGRLRFRKPKTVTISVRCALDRVLAEDIIAQEDLPRFDRSAVDGYALRAQDTVDASQFKPRALKITTEDKILKGQATQVWTGNSIPKGADAVAMLENTKRIDNEFQLKVPLTPHENISRKGEDVRKGEKIMQAGTRLRAYHLGLSAALGKAELKVYEKPVIAVLTTGDEIIEVGEKPRQNRIYDSNRIIVPALCLELGAEPLDMGICRDDVEEIAAKLSLGLEKADAVITTGGTSVGFLDLVPEAVNRIGNPGVIVHGVAMRPGMPTALAAVKEKPILVLSGNPVAAIIGFEAFGRPLLSRLLGLNQVETRPVVMAKMGRRVTTALGRKNFVRVNVVRKEDEFVAEPVSAKGSGAISTMTRANGYIIVSENREGLEKGETVLVHVFGLIKEMSS